MNTPVILIIFNRPSTTEKVFETIRQAKPSKLLVIADGPRPDQVGEVEKCMAARSVIDKVDWYCEGLKKYSDSNLGCALSPANGLNWAFEHVEEAIILEDDCIPHPTFYRFCEETLDRYRYDTRVMHISGNNYHPGIQRSDYSYFFSRYPLSWGWATWRRAWQNFDFVMKQWPEIRTFNYLNDIFKEKRIADSWAKTFQFVYDKNLDCWDFQWTFACFLQNGLSIIPSVNLVSNIGSGQDATHTTSENNHYLNRLVEPLSFPLKHSPYIIRDEHIDQLIQKTIFNYHPTLTQRIQAKFVQTLNRGKSVSKHCLNHI